MKRSLKSAIKLVLVVGLAISSFSVFSFVEAPKESHTVFAESGEESVHIFHLTPMIKKNNTKVVNTSIDSILLEIKKREAKKMVVEEQRVLAANMAKQAVNEAIDLGALSAPSNEQWEAIRRCESHGNYSAISSNGIYFGAYQFSQATWNNLAAMHSSELYGMNPAHATPTDQDFMALKLYQDSGHSVWPYCGKYLT